jgi:PAS domain S-box-containing protein
MRTEKKGSRAQALRSRAEAIAREAGVAEQREGMSPEEVRETLHELRVHQIELETQNEELRRVDATRARYCELYDMAPVGYCTVSEKGLILEANLTTGTLLGVARGALVDQPIARFILKDDQVIYYFHRKRLLEFDEPPACELRMVKQGGSIFWARMEATTGRDERGDPVFRVMISDISRAQAEPRSGCNWPPASSRTPAKGS